MIRLLDTDNLALPSLALPGASSPLPPASCLLPTCDLAFRPDPKLSGELVVDPEIHLPSPGMDVDIGYFYNASATNNGPFGYARTLSTNQTAQASGSPTVVTLTRGDGARATF